MNLINSAAQQKAPPPPYSGPPPDTPQPKELKPSLHLVTPSPAPPRPHIHLNDSSLNSSSATPLAPGPGMETPLLHYNSINSTPGQASPCIPALSGISSLNITADTSTECASLPQHKLAAFMPPPLKPKHRRPAVSRGPVRAFSPSFGMLGDTPSPAGVAAKLLEFSSPQVRHQSGGTLVTE